MNTENLLRQEAHFAFGKNWLDYAAKIDTHRIDQAVVDLQRLSGLQSLSGKSFLDIGCGSGLHAVAAVRMGAARVVGYDIDPDSVAAARSTVARFAPDAPATFEVRSVFDMDPDDCGTFDIVYSWGVLHHTGDMNRAIACACSLVAPNGALLLALYKKTPFCGMWRVIKRWYSHAGAGAQRRASRFYVFLTRVLAIVERRNFNTHVRDYGGKRGMDFYNDVHDWLGGYPYQSISPAECHALLANLGFTVEHEFVKKPRRLLPGLMGSGCDEYAFRRARGA